MDTTLNYSNNDFFLDAGAFTWRHSMLHFRIFSFCQCIVTGNTSQMPVLPVWHNAYEKCNFMEISKEK